MTSGSPAAASSVGSHVLVREDVVDDRAGLDHAGPADHRRHAVAAFPVGVLLAAERRGAAVGPGERLGAVVGRVHDDRVVGDAELVELGQQLADHAVVLDHAVGVDAEPGLALGLRLEVGPDVHPGRVVPDEERLARPGRALSMKPIAAVRNSPSTVSIRFLVSGPVSSHCCLPQARSAGPRRLVEAVA